MGEDFVISVLSRHICDVVTDNHFERHIGIHLCGKPLSSMYSLKYGCILMEHLSLDHFLQEAKYYEPKGNREPRENREDESKQLDFSAKYFLPLHQFYWHIIYM